MLSYFVSDLTARCAIDFQPLNLLHIVRLWAPTVNYSRRYLISASFCRFRCVFFFCFIFPYPTRLICPSWCLLPSFSSFRFQNNLCTRLVSESTYFVSVFLARFGVLLCVLPFSNPRIFLQEASRPWVEVTAFARSLASRLGRSRKEDASRSHWCGSLIGR